MHAVRSRRSRPGGGHRVVCPEQASEFFSDDVLQHLLVQGAISDQLLELPVLFLELTETSELCDSHAGELLLPAVERHARDAHLPAHFLNRHAALCLPQGEGDLLLRIPRSLHGMTLFLEAESSRKTITYAGAVFGGKVTGFSNLVLRYGCHIAQFSEGPRSVPQNENCRTTLVTLALPGSDLGVDP